MANKLQKLLKIFSNYTLWTDFIDQNASFWKTTFEKYSLLKLNTMYCNHQMHVPSHYDFSDFLVSSEWANSISNYLLRRNENMKGACFKLSDFVNFLIAEIAILF